MAAERRLLTIDELCRDVLNHPKSWFYKNRADLEELGFPMPVPGLGHRYDPVAVEAWLARWRLIATTEAERDEAPAASTLSLVPPEADDEEVTRILAERTRRLAAGEP